MKQIMGIMAFILLLSALAIAGCISSPSPAPTLAPTVGPTAMPTAVPSPTPIGGNNGANIQFNYQLGTQTQFSGLQPAAPGDLLYLLQVNVSSDKPVQTSQAWFGMEYKVNATDSIHDSNSSISFVAYPSKIISWNTTSARGEMIFELPAKMAPGYPKPYYYMPMEDQPGPYYVYGKIYGTVGDVQ